MRTLFSRILAPFWDPGFPVVSARHLVLISRKCAENQKVETVRIGFPARFYLENQWKPVAAVVFLENHGTLNFLSESNLFKGLFHGKCQNSHF